MKSTMAEKAAVAAGNDGQRFEGLAAAVSGATRWRNDDGSVSYTFSDGSSILETDGGWDVVHHLCECGLCWQGAGHPRCLK